MEYLIERGYTLIARNWRCRSGEIDIIAEIDHVLVFIEVRTRSSQASFGTAEESINYRKQKQVRETAQFYIYQTKRFKFQKSVLMPLPSLYRLLREVQRIFT